MCSHTQKQIIFQTIINTQNKTHKNKLLKLKYYAFKMFTHTQNVFKKINTRVYLRNN